MSQAQFNVLKLPLFLWRYLIRNQVLLLFGKIFGDRRAFSRAFGATQPRQHV
jgi:hypothetical protein